jgi:sorting nexin-29
MVYLSKTIPNEWKRSIIVPILKKGDKSNPENYRGISLLNMCYKICSRLLNEKLKKFTEQFLLECQNEFRKGRSCTDSIFTLKLLIEKRRAFNLETHIAFLDF